LSSTLKPKINWFLVGTFLLVLLAGCDSKPKAEVVDFSKVVGIARATPEPPEKRELRVAIGAMVSPKETMIYYHHLLEYLGQALDARINFVQRKTYEEINRLFETGEVDLGLICSGPYASGGARYGMELVAAPLVRGKAGYQAYLIVNAESPYSSLEDLKGKVFAFTDPDSNTGHIVPLYWLHKRGHTPESFFKKSLFTYSHDNSILAVSRNLVDGAAVDGLVWEYYQAVGSPLTGKTQVILKSDYFGMPPVVVRRSLPVILKKQLAAAILNMHGSQEGRAILDGLMIDRFVTVGDDAYSSIRRMKAALDAQAETS